VDDPAVNAFALPGGFIYVTRGILAHFDSEAQLAAVLGHEIGHVTGRHSADQMSRQQLATLGLGVGLAVKPELEPLAGIAQTGIGLLSLKFGRDHEREADALGLRYMSAAGYAPHEMSAVFRMLERVGAQGKDTHRLPGWLSTHPSPQDRLQRIESSLPKPPAGNVNRDAYLRQLDGMVFGENPREGFFNGNEFLHPELRFRFVFPRGFKLQNRRDAVLGVSPAQDAAVTIAFAAGDSPEAAARVFLSRGGVISPGARRVSVQGFDALECPFAAQDSSVQGTALFLADQGRVYRLLGYSVTSRWPGYAQSVADSLASFSRLADPRALDVVPDRLEIVRLDARLSLAEFAARYPGAPATTLALINQVTGDRLGPGLAKRVVAGRRPS
jgi:predicted Zn-dependent protease